MREDEVGRITGFRCVYICMYNILGYIEITVKYKTCKNDNVFEIN